MRTHRGFKVTRLMVVLLALSPLGARAQSHPSDGMSPQADAGGNPAYAQAMPMAMAPSQFAYPAMPASTGYGQPPWPGYAATPYGVNPAAYTTGSGAPQPFPVAPAQPLPGGYDASMASYCPPEAACPSCNGCGCPECLGLGGYLAGGLSALLPFSDGGCCAPRWYDITADFVYLTRDQASRRLDFTSEGILGDIVLSTDNLDFDPAATLQLTGAVQVFAGSALEFTFLGLNNWSTSNSVYDETDDLFSVFSDFGIDPLGGFDETDRSRFQSLSYSSSLDSFELHLRKRWQGPNCRLQGSWLAGVRYVYLMEDFQYYTLGGDIDANAANGFQSRGQMTYDTRAKNSLTGFQCGGDLWTCIVPGVTFGGEMKAGIYGNYAQQGTHIVASTTDPVQTNEAFESDSGGDLAFVGQGNIMLVYKTSPNWALRGGYTFMYLDGVALAAENFNSQVPFSANRTVQPVNDNGGVFYHGFLAGLEWMW